MCGIIGYVKGRKEIDKTELQYIMHDMFIASQARGTDATGYGYINKDGRAVVDKAPIVAAEFVKRLNDINFDEVNILLGHTRAATKGDPKNSENNHPIVSKDSGLVLVHNGIVNTKKKLKTDGEVDSEVILRLIELRQDVVAGIKFAEENYSGSAAYALIGVDFPNRVYLVRSGNPMVLAYIKELDLVLFASTETIIKAGLNDYKCFLGFFWEKRKRRVAIFQEMDDNSMLSIQTGVKGISIKKETFKKKESGFYYVKSDYQQKDHSGQWWQRPVLTVSEGGISGRQKYK